jgi:hypothetical protein
MDVSPAALTDGELDYSSRRSGHPELPWHLTGLPQTARSGFAGTRPRAQSTSTDGTHGPDPQVYNVVILARVPEPRGRRQSNVRPNATAPGPVFYGQSGMGLRGQVGEPIAAGSGAASAWEPYGRHEPPQSAPPEPDPRHPRRPGTCVARLYSLSGRPGLSLGEQSGDGRMVLRSTQGPPMHSRGFDFERNHGPNRGIEPFRQRGSR